MKLICFATHEEASHSLTRFNAEEVHTGLYKSDIGPIVITGIGPFAAHAVSMTLSEEIDCFLNIGLAGSLREDLAIGSIHPVASVSKFLWHPKGKDFANISFASQLPFLTLQDQGLRLCTADFPIYGETKELASLCDFVDMEGYGIALSAKVRNIECRLYKIISDHCSESSASQIKTRLPELSEQMACFLEAVC